MKGTALVKSSILLISLATVFGVGRGMVISEEEKEKWMHPDHSQSNRIDSMQNPEHEDAAFWKKDAQDRLRAKLTRTTLVEAKAKNVIFYLGDGMSVPTITAARIFKGQQVDKLPFGEEGELHMDSFPFTGASKTFCADAQVADSACSATAYLCGTKANDGTAGVTPAVLQGDCNAQADPANHVSSVLAWAQAEGKSTGIITTTKVTHASPSGTYAHIAHRDWENDGMIIKDGQDPKICEDIARQLITREPGNKIDVILGGGRQQFLPNTTVDPESPAPPAPTVSGFRLDETDLIQEWKDRHSEFGENAKYVYLKNELLAIDTTKVSKLLGLFAPGHIGYLDQQERDNDPSLEEMVKVAIEILSKNDKGFFLFVEGGRIDHAHHDNFIKRSLWETIEFDKAIKRGDDMTNDDDTLIVITADHAHAMNMAGYPYRGNPVHKFSHKIDNDGLPYVTLGYANGPSKTPWMDPANNNQTRRDITNDPFDDVDYQPPVPVPVGSETHGGDDVLIFAKGPYAHLLTGVHQQSYIPHVVGFAACIGEGAKHCDNINEVTDDPSKGSSATIFLPYVASQIFALFLSLFAVRF